MADLSGERIVVTGGGNGIGLATAVDLLQRHAEVIILDLNVELVRQYVSDEGTQPGLHYFEIDITNRDALFILAEKIEQEIGAVTGLVTCAGITHPAPSATMTTEIWHKVLRVNLDGTFFACQAFGAAMMAHGRGAIVTVSSALGLSAQEGRANYIASKWGVIGITKTLAIEWAARNVRVNCVAPGPVATALFQKLPEEFRERVVYSRTPLGRAAEVEEVAQAIAFLLSRESSFINGSILAVDGGYTCGHGTDMGRLISRSN